MVIVTSTGSDEIGAPARTRAPLVGLTAYSERARFGVWDTDSVVLHRLYVDAISRAGGIPVVLPPVTTGVDEMVDAVDALVLAGGPDLDPVRYGAPTHPATGRPHRLRDEFELTALRAALRQDMPVLGICRGLQVLNTELGGTLRQHIDEPGGTSHQNAGGAGVHELAIAHPSRMAGILGIRAKVRCYHHQAVDTIPEELHAVATAEDGTVEALEHLEHRFVLGVQWHPEAQDERDDRLFEALVAAAS